MKSKLLIGFISWYHFTVHDNILPCVEGIICRSHKFLWWKLAKLDTITLLKWEPLIENYMVSSTSVVGIHFICVKCFSKIKQKWIDLKIGVNMTLEYFEI